MKYKIGIFGSSGNETEEMKAKARTLGEALSQTDVILITGACTGLPYDVVSSTRLGNKQLEIWGYSPAYDYEEQASLNPHDDNTIYAKLFYTPREFPIQDLAARRKYRNVISTANCDAGIIISGRWGSMNEFTNLFDMGKVVAVYTNTGGIADELESLGKKITKPSNAVVLYESDPVILVKNIISEIEKRIKS